jgi:competence protein ComEC
MPLVAALPALALLVGSACGAAVDLIGWPVLWILPLAVAGPAVAYVCECRAAFVAFTVAAFWWGGCALGSHARHQALDTSLRAALDREFGGFAIDTLGPGGRHDPIRVLAALTEDAAPVEDVTTLRMQVRQITINGIPRAVDGDVAFAVSRSRPIVRGPGAASGEASADPADDWVAGRTLQLMATFRRPARYLNEGVPDFERDLALAGTTLFGSVKSGLLVDVVADGNVVQEAAARARRHVRRALGRWVVPRDRLSAAIVAAVLIGDRSGLPDDIRNRLQAAGTYHVIAISGGNIAILAGLSFALLFLCGLAGRPAAFATLILLLGYATVVTAGASVWRATVMASLYLVARILDHRTPPWQAMCVAAALVVCANPLDVRDAGFLLTFGATAALLEAARRMTTEQHAAAATTRRLNVSSGPLRWLLASLVASTAAEIVLLPVSASSFSRVTSAGLLLNLAAVPLMTIVQIAGIVVALLDRVDRVASAAAWAADLAARGIVWSSQLVDVWPWLASRVPPPPLALIVLYYGGLATALISRGKARGAGVFVLVAAGVAIASGVQMPKGRVPAGNLRLTIFDVGQGDASLIELPDGSRLQIDAGGIPFAASGFDVGARVLAPALWARGVRAIETLLVTHGDPDHIGGALSLVDDFRPRRVWDGIRVPRHMPMETLLARARNTGVVSEQRIAGQRLSFGGTRIRVLHPPPADWQRRRVRNDDSVVLEILYGDVAILMTGDIGADIERAIVARLTPARVRILKVAHHGSRTSSSSELLESWRPQIAVISCGRGNTFGHPAPEVIARLNSIGAQIYRTDVDGQITIETDGVHVSRRTFADDVR